MRGITYGYYVIGFQSTMRSFRDSKEFQEHVAQLNGVPISSEVAKELMGPLAVAVANKFGNETDIAEAKGQLSYRLDRWAADIQGRLTHHRHLMTFPVDLSTVNRRSANALIVSFGSDACEPMTLGWYTGHLGE